MPLSLKAAYSYSATSALTGAWSLTASASIASGDLLILHVVSRTTTTASAGLIVTPTDNAGGIWQALRTGAASGVAVSIFYNASATTTANFQIALPVANGKTVSARAAHVLVIGGHDGSAPIDLQTYREINSGASSNTTRTASTSLSTTVGNELIVALMGRFGVVTSATADAAWTRLGDAINVASSPVNIGLDSFSRPAPTPGIYQLSASLNVGGGTPTTFIALYGVRPLATASGSLSGTAALAFGTAGTLGGKANAGAAVAVSLATSAAIAGRGGLSATTAIGTAPAGTLAGKGNAGAAVAVSLATSAAIGGRGELGATTAIGVAPFATLGGKANADAAVAVSLATSAAIAGRAGLSATPAIDLAASGTLRAAGNMAAGGGLAFSGGGVLDSSTTPVDSSPTQATPLLGGGWDPRQFRKMLEVRRRDLIQRAQRLARDADGARGQSSAADVVAVQQRLASFAVAAPRQAWRLREQAQALAAIEARLATLDASAVRAALEREDEEILLLAA